MCFLARAAVISFCVRNNATFYTAEHVFSAESVTRTTAKFASLKPIRMVTRQPAKKAAVLIPLCEVDGKVALLFTLRAVHLKTHRGQVSFPGGMQDLNDKSLEETALRETHEELGIPNERIEIWGRGSELVTKYETAVTPVIGHIKGDLKMADFKINPKEVEEVFTVTLEDLCNVNLQGHTQFRRGFLSTSMPVFLGGRCRIWGLTAVMTNRFLKSLLPTNAYSHNIRYIPPVKSSTNSKTVNN